MTDAVVRPWRATDAEALVAASTDPDVALQLAVDPGDRDGVRAVLERRVELVGPAFYAFAIDVAGTAVGEVGLSRVEPRHRTGWLSYWLAPQARGHGLASRALASVVTWAFAELDLFRVELGFRVNNPKSGGVAHRAGFTDEGVERARLEYDGVRYDVVRSARLRTDPAPDLALLPVLVTG